MSYLIDTNVLLRFFDLADTRNAEIVRALDIVTRASEETFVCAQVLVEYWNAEHLRFRTLPGDHPFDARRGAGFVSTVSP